MFGVSRYLLILTLFSCTIPLPHYASSNKHDCESLLSISQTTLSPSPSSPLNWSYQTTKNCCHWEGVACNRAGRVARLSLPARGLTGSLSPSLANLTHLSHLNFSQNQLLGPLPDCRLPASIHTVDLSNNLLHGTIPASVFKSAWNLISFNVSNNSFTGNLPSPICANASLLKHLDFSFNHFGGEIPQGLLAGCSNLEIFSAGYNSLSGLLPRDLYNASALLEMSLHVNELSGNIHGDIARLKNLTTLELHHNILSGALPQEIGTLPRLKRLLLHTNNFSGPLPMSLMNCTTLQHLILWANGFQGDLSAFNFSKLVALRKLDLGLNNFTGNLPSSLYSCKSLRAVRLSYNQLEGQILPDIVALKSLSFLAVSNTMLTNISGAIKILMGLKDLKILILCDNAADGDVFLDDTIAVGLDGFPRLETLAVSGCQLSVEFPTWVAKSSRSLQILDLSSNKLRGSIPIWLGNFSRLFYLDLSHNLFSGQLFPQQLCQLPALTSAAAKGDSTFLELPFYYSRDIISENKWQHLQYNRLSNLPRAIYLGNNGLTGSIPERIGLLKFLQRLDLKDNRFHGGIPDQLSDITNLEKLDLSGNCLSGKIPPRLASLTFLNSFNVSNNNLSGKIPESSQLQSFNASAYKGNAELCGQPLENECPDEKGDEEDIDVGNDDGDDDETAMFYLSAGLGYFTGSGIVLVTLLLMSSWRNAYFNFLVCVKDKFCLCNQRIWAQ